jgi:hypothetical protein
MKRLRQERDPNFRKAQASKAEADTTAMPPPPSRMPPKRKKGLGYKVTTATITLLCTRLSYFHLLFNSASLHCTYNTNEPQVAPNGLINLLGTEKQSARKLLYSEIYACHV